MALGLTAAAHADVISFVTEFKNVGFLQTGNGNALSGNGDFFSTDLTSNDGTFTTVQLAYPGPGSPASLGNSVGDPTDYHFQTPSFSDQASMDAAYPFGTYQFNASGSGTGSTSDSFTADDYAQSNPYLTGTNYTALQGMDPSQAFTFHFSPYVTGSNAAFSFIFLTIADNTKGQTVFDDGFLAPTTSSVLLPANTLAFGDSFTYALDYSNRDGVPSPGATFDAQLGFDLRTDGNFSTAAAPVGTPEPSTLGLLGCGLIAGWVFRRKR